MAEPMEFMSGEAAIQTTEAMEFVSGACAPFVTVFYPDAQQLVRRLDG